MFGKISIDSVQKKESPIEIVKKSSYFHNFSREQAEKYLSELQVEGFLIRPSSIPGHLAMTMTFTFEFEGDAVRSLPNKLDITHTLITPEQMAEVASADSVQAMIENIFRKELSSVPILVKFGLVTKAVRQGFAVLDYNQVREEIYNSPFAQIKQIIDECHANGVSVWKNYDKNNFTVEVGQEGSEYFLFVRDKKTDVMKVCNISIAEFNAAIEAIIINLGAIKDYSDTGMRPVSFAKALDIFIIEYFLGSRIRNMNEALVSKAGLYSQSSFHGRTNQENIKDSFRKQIEVCLNNQVLIKYLPEITYDRESQQFTVYLLGSLDKEAHQEEYIGLPADIKNRALTQTQIEAYERLLRNALDEMQETKPAQLPEMG